LDQPQHRRRVFLLWLGGIYLLHLIGVAYIFPSQVVFADVPYGGGDYQTHFHQTFRIKESLQSGGGLWAYEPRFLAGHPMGLIFDVDNKAHFLFSYGLSRLGMPLVSAYNLFSVLSAMLYPLVLLLIARLFRLDSRAQLVAMAVGAPIYFLDTASRFFTSAGMISYVMSAHVALLVLVLFWRLLQSPGRAGLRYFIPLLILFPLVHLIHVWAFAILVGPMVVFYLRYARRLPLVGHVQVLVLGAAVVLANLHWLLPAISHFGIMTPSHKLGQAKPHFFLLDLFEILPFSPPAIVQTTLFRYLALGAAAVLLFRWYREKDERFFPGVTIIGWLLFLGYVSAYVPLFGLTEPYRFVLALAFAAAALCGGFLADIFRQGFSPAGRVLLVLGLVLLGPQVARQVFASAPELIPLPQRLTPKHDPPPWDRGAPVKAPEVTLRMKSVPQHYLQVAKYLRQHAREEGRILVEPWEVGEFLGWATNLHIIGGFPDRRMIYERSNIFREVPGHDRYFKQAFADYLVRYNIRYLLVHMPLFPHVETRRDLLQLMVRLGPYRLYRTRHRANFFLRGSGRVRTSINRIVLEDVVPDPRDGKVAIRFHYFPTLRCAPACRLEKVPLADSKASFIQIAGDPKLAGRITLEHRP